MTFDAVHAAFVCINENQIATDHIHDVRIHFNHDINMSNQVLYRIIVNIDVLKS